MQQQKLFLSALVCLWVGSASAMGNMKMESTSETRVLSTQQKGATKVGMKDSEKGATDPNFSHLNAIDMDSNDLNQLNRKLQLEKVTAEIKKLKNVANLSSKNNSGGNENAQTIVTGVAIDQNGQRIAWLQFADGGSLTVNIGSPVGHYIVSNISMTGVTLSAPGNGREHKHPRTVFLKRMYVSSRDGQTKNNNRSNNSVFFGPSPVITGANADTDNVPPIITSVIR